MLLVLNKVSRVQLLCSTATHWSFTLLPSMPAALVCSLGTPCPSQQDQAPILSFPTAADLSHTALVTVDRHVLFICSNQFTSVLYQTGGQPAHRAEVPCDFAIHFLSNTHWAGGSGDS